MVARDEGERFHFLNTLHTAKIKGEHTNGRLTAVEFLAPKNFGPRGSNGSSPPSATRPKAAV